MRKSAEIFSLVVLLTACGESINDAKKAAKEVAAELGKNIDVVRIEPRVQAELALERLRNELRPVVSTSGKEVTIWLNAIDRREYYYIAGRMKGLAHSSTGKGSARVFIKSATTGKKEVVAMGDVVSGEEGKDIELFTVTEGGPGHHTKDNGIVISITPSNTVAISATGSVDGGFDIHYVELSAYLVTPDEFRKKVAEQDNDGNGGA